MANREELENVARRLLAGSLTPEAFVSEIEQSGVDALADASLDLDRSRRCGYPEVVFGSGKTIEAIERIVERLLDTEMEVLVTRLEDESAQKLAGRWPDARYNSLARTWRVGRPVESRHGAVTVVTAGTSDRPVAEEARETLDWMGVEVTTVHDVGVAGPHRLRSRLGELSGRDAIVAVAGMEGALPSVVGGYVDCPIIAVPTSVGYGANLGGVAALLSMLNSCAANVAVVNIDAGFKGGYLAGLIAQRRNPKPD